MRLNRFGQATFLPTNKVASKGPSEQAGRMFLSHLLSVGLPKRQMFLLASVLTLGLVSSPGLQAAEGPVFNKVLFLGNSITLHGPKADIGWTGNWGMAASSAEKDYVHLVTAGLTRAAGKAPQILVRNIASFERDYTSFDLEKQLRDAIDFQADLIILAIGENVKGLSSPEEETAFAKQVLRLLKLMKGDRSPTLVIRSSFWPNVPKDRALRQVCDQLQGRFVDLKGIGASPENRASLEREYKHQGVAAHPGDRGMRAIAEAILQALEITTR